jgi:ABC-type amino acid transport substrate-binding protein
MCRNNTGTTLAAKMMKPIKSAIGALAIALTVTAFARVEAVDGKSISIVAQEMPGLIEPGATLPYNRLLDALLSGSPVPTGVTIMPGYRGPNEWVRGNYQCIFGGISAPGHKLPPNDGDISAPDWETLRISNPFNLLKVHAFSPPDQPTLRSFADLDGKTIAVDQVLYFDLQLHTGALQGASLARVQTATAALDLLSAGRVDAAFAYDNDVALYSGLTGKKAFPHDRAFTLLELEESMMCWPGPHVDTLIKHVNTQLETLAQNGQLKAMVPGLPAK